MTFRGYKIQQVYCGYQVKDKNGVIVYTAPTQLNAMQWIEGAVTK